MSAIDIKVIDQYRALDPVGGFGLARQILEVYLKHSTENLAQAERAIAEGNADSLRRSAHILKSSTANVGGLALAALFDRLEGLGKAGRLDEAAPLLVEAKRQYGQFRSELDALLSKVSS